MSGMIAKRKTCLAICGGAHAAARFRRVVSADGNGGAG